MNDILNRFLKKAPVAVMVRASLAHLFADATLDALFDRTAAAQYTRELTFSTLVRLMTRVVFTSQPSVHAAYRGADDVPVSIRCLYDKLSRLETGVSQALVGETAEAMRGVLEALPAPPREPLAGFRLRTLDGNFLAGTERRLGCLRGSGAAALPGMSLVVRDGRTGLLTDLIPCQDAYTGERSLFPGVLALVRPGDLWLADRNFCTDDYLGGIADRQAFFLIRHHAGTKLEPLGEPRYVGSGDGGDLYEGRVTAAGRTWRCIAVRLFRPVRDGSTEIRLLTNVPASKVGARRLAELYRTRWRIETAFQELTESLRCELNTLGYPKAALFGFALAVTAYNLLVLIRQALSSAAGPGRGEEALSSYHLANEVAAVSEGLAIAVAEEAWARFAAMGAGEFAAWLHEAAGGMDWRRYRKSPRGPKKPADIKRTRRGAHRSTARVLESHRKAPSKG
jgi:Transposase DDE domain